MPLYPVSGWFIALNFYCDAEIRRGHCPVSRYLVEVARLDSWTQVLFWYKSRDVGVKNVTLLYRSLQQQQKNGLEWSDVFLLKHFTPGKISVEHTVLFLVEHEVYTIVKNKIKIQTQKSIH